MLSAPAMPASPPLPEWMADVKPHLPQIGGSFEAGGDLGALTWFRTGGNAELLFKPDNAESLALFLSHLPPEVPLHVIGAGSNLLVRDGGVRGAVIVMGEGFAGFSLDEQSIRAGSGLLLRRLARQAAEAGRTGFEFMRGIPGTVGGATRMNAGAYGSEMAALIVEITIMTRNGTKQTLPATELDFAYRASSLPQDVIVLEASLLAYPAPQARIDERMKEVRQARQEAQPTGARTGGSSFKNPPGAKAWELIERAGCRFWREGRVSVSARHANFLVNEGGARASDIEALGERIRAQVKEKTGIVLEWEIHRIGEAE